MWGMGSLVPRPSHVFQRYTRKIGKAWSICDVIITYLPPFLPCYMPRPVEWWQVRNDYITKSTRPSRFLCVTLKNMGRPGDEARVWGSAWQNSQVLVQCDNQGTVAVVNSRGIGRISRRGFLNSSAHSVHENFMCPLAHLPQPSGSSCNILHGALGFGPGSILSICRWKVSNTRAVYYCSVNSTQAGVHR